MREYDKRGDRYPAGNRVGGMGNSLRRSDAKILSRRTVGTGIQKSKGSDSFEIPGWNARKELIQKSGKIYSLIKVRSDKFTPDRRAPGKSRYSAGDRQRDGALRRWQVMS